MASLGDLKLDVEELKKLIASSERQRVKNALQLELKKIEADVAKLEQVVNGAGDAKPSVPAQPRIPTVDVKTYAWDQSEKFMKIYATVNGVEQIPEEQVTCNYTNRSFHLRCQGINKKNYSCHIANLMEDIVPLESKIKIKKDTVLVMLKKSEKKTWPYLTDRDRKDKDKDKKKPDISDSKDPSDGLMTMMKQMYDDGDDEMKRTIAKAWSESRDKKDGAPPMF